MIKYKFKNNRVQNSNLVHISYQWGASSQLELGWNQRDGQYSPCTQSYSSSQMICSMMGYCLPSLQKQNNGNGGGDRDDDGAPSLLFKNQNLYRDSKNPQDMEYLTFNPSFLAKILANSSSSSTWDLTYFLLLSFLLKST